MVQDIEMVRELHSGRQQLADGPNDATFVEITFRIVIFAYYKDTRVVSPYNHHKVVEVFEIPVVVRNENSVGVDGVPQMHGVIFASHPGVRWPLHVMPRAAQQPRQKERRAIIV